MLSFPEVNELAEEVRRVFEEFDRHHGPNCRGASSLCTPALDVVETVTAIEVYLDVPGVASENVRVLFKDGNLVIVGEKLPTEATVPEGSAYHLVERGFGRFARVIRLNAAVDASRATALLEAGELHISVPRIQERRGREIPVRVEERKGAPA
jgi:HSP20 family protein